MIVTSEMTALDLARRFEDAGVAAIIYTDIARDGVLAGLNRRYYTTFQFKRMRRFAERLTLAPPDLIARIEALLVTPLPEAFNALFTLDGEVLALLATHAPQIDLSAAHERRTRFALDAATR